MVSWMPEMIWAGKDCYVIGGGPSLKGFDWSLLRDRLTIGCNDTAHELGHGIVDIAVFGDRVWYDSHKDELVLFHESGGEVVTCLPNFRVPSFPWLKVMARTPRGLSLEGLGWNGSTGAAAVNLALLLGAVRVFLLGFDMKIIGGKFNWYEGDEDDPLVYNRFLDGFGYVARDLPHVFPEAGVFNVTDDSVLDVFPKIPMRKHFGQEVWVGAADRA